MFFQLFPIFLGLFCNSMAFSVIYPFGSLMVQEFGISQDKSSTGFWVGVLAFAMMIGRLIGAPIWGAACDKIGRRPPALIGISTIAIFSMAFGLSRDYMSAMVSRLCLGFFSCVGLTGIVIVSDISHSDPGYTPWLGLSWQVGSIAGSIVGGLFPGVLFDNYPFLAPNIIVSILSFVAFLVALAFLEETLKKLKHFDELNSRTYTRLLKDSSVQLLCLMYLILNVNMSGFYELISLWCWADLKNGGFEMSTIEIGSILAFSGGFLVCTEVFIYKRLRHKIDILLLTRYSLLSSVLIFLIFPLGIYLRRTECIKYVFIISLSILWLLNSFILQINLVVFTNLRLSFYERGKLNGLMIAFMSIANGLGPLLIGTVFQFSVTSDLELFLRIACPFILMSALFMAAFFISIHRNFELIVTNE